MITDDPCWYCGKSTRPVSEYGAAQHQYECSNCDVSWVAMEFWTASQRWLELGGFPGYIGFLHRRMENSLKLFRLKEDELIDFGKPNAPGAVA